MTRYLWKNHLLLLAAGCALLGTGATRAQTPAPEEHRGVWISTVFRLDFPGPASNDTPQEQRQRLITLLDDAQAAGLNTAIFQVRGMGEAMYISTIEPWSQYLTDTQGQAPARLWDPLQFTIDECRRRGMEIHAWFNPYRVGSVHASSFNYAPNHVLNTHPQIVKYITPGSDKFYWINPGHPDAIPYILSVILDVVKRYDIDAVHFDDYFYPSNYDYPDDDEYNAYTAGGGLLSKEDWRRDNVNSLISQIRPSIAAIPGKEHVRFGVSPAGIWQSGVPSGIVGNSAYSALYADTRKWLQEGWVDYLAPQLYWGMAEDGHSTQQDYDTLLNWWTSPTQNPLNRHVFPGLAAYKIPNAGWEAQHIVNEVLYTQNSSPAKGNIFFRANNLLGSGTGGLSTLLKAGPYQADAAPPAFTHMDNVPPAEPSLAWSGSAGTGYTLYWTPQGSEYPQWYVVYWTPDGSNWSHKVVPDWQRSLALPGSSIQAAVQAVDRLGNRSSMTPVSLAGASPPIPPQLTSITMFDHDSTPLDFYNGSGTNSGVTPGTDTESTEEANNRIDPRAASPGTRSRKVPFTWTASSGGRYRLSTLGPNPMIDLTKGVGVYIKVLNAPIDLALGIRETGGSGPIGANGGSTGAIEISSVQRIAPSPHWQYVYFDVPNETYTSLTGDGKLDGSWGVLECFMIYQVPGTTGLQTIYIDEIHQGDAHTPLGEPLRPRSLQATTPPPSAVNLTWNPVPAQDLAGYRVYRGTSPNVQTTPDNLVATVTAPSWTDTTAQPHSSYYYVVTAVDHFGYESPASTELPVTTVPVGLSAFQAD